MGRTTSGRRVGWVLALAAVLGMLTVAAVDERSEPMSNGERVYALSQEFACPVCGGQSIAESDVPIAREIKREIRRRLDQGQTDAQIRQYLGNLYPGMDLRPTASGVTGLVWFLPVFVFVVAIGGLVAVFRRWRNEPVAAASDADRALVEAALSRAERGDPASLSRAERGDPASLSRAERGDPASLSRAERGDPAALSRTERGDPVGTPRPYEGSTDRG